jgi:hypothetical protein
MRVQGEAAMKCLVVLAAALALAIPLPAAAQSAGTFTQVRKIELKGPAPAPAATKPAKNPAALFGCEARGGGTCHFRIFYPGGRSRDVVLPAGMKTPIPDLRIGQDRYCVVVNKKPVHKCPRKVVNANYNS